MLPSYPVPGDARVRQPVDAKLHRGWRFDSKKRRFFHERKEIFEPFSSLPQGTQIVHKAPDLASANEAKLTEAQRDLCLYIQVILPETCKAQDFLAEIQSWPCIESAEIRQMPTLPHLG